MGDVDWEGHHDKHVCILGEGSVFKLLCWGVPHVSNDERTFEGFTATCFGWGLSRDRGGL